jgi:hypothetical protein
LCIALGISSQICQQPCNQLPQAHINKTQLVVLLPLLLQEFDSSGNGDGNPFMVVWGQAVLILYIAVVNILIMSLVVAVITHAYNPESVKAHAIVMQAESTFHYDFHGEPRCIWLVAAVQSVNTSITQSVLRYCFTSSI